jgi:Protein of unknwon function (DUF3008)
MPAKSKKQQMAAGAALAATRGERSTSSLKGASKGMSNRWAKKSYAKWRRPKRQADKKTQEARFLSAANLTALSSRV